MIKTYKFRLYPDKEQENILKHFIGTSNITLPLRSFIERNKNKLKDKKISIVLTYSGGGDVKTIKKLKECLKVDSFQQILVLKNRKNSNIDKILENFCNNLRKDSL